MSDSESIVETDSSFVYLGLVDTPLKETDELSFEDTFIGGMPKWLHDESVPSEEMLVCGACKSKDNMKLLLQAFSPLDYDQMEDIQKKNGIHNMNYISASNDRVLYVFMCMKCQRKPKSVRCIRGIKKNTDVKADSKQLPDKIESLTALNTLTINPFDVSTKTETNPFANPFQEKQTSQTSQASNKSFEKESKKAIRKLHDSLKDKEFDNQKAFRNYLLYVEEESFKNKKPDHLKLPENLKIDKSALDLNGEIEADFDKDPIKLDPRTEKLSKFLDDDIFQKFQEIVAYNPLQVLRYDIGGIPLLYAKCKTDLGQTVSNPSYNPSSKRIYELQLMPKMIMDLEENVSLEGGMEWGTIMVFTDIEDYMPNFDKNGIGYVEEYIKVQWETRD